MFRQLRSESLAMIEKDIEDGNNAHEKIAKDVNASVGLVIHLSNHLNNGEPSGHYHLRKAFVTILQTTKEEQSKKNILEGHDGPRSFCSSYFSFCYLSDELWKELDQLCEENGIRLYISKSHIARQHGYLLKEAAVTEETKRKWEVEKKYLNYWLEEARKGKVSEPDSKGRLFIPWKTDAQRLASCYQTNWIEK